MSGQGASAGYRCGVLVLTLALVVGSVSWLRAWWRQGAGAGCRCWALVARVVGTGCRCGVLVSGAGAAYGAGAGAVSWLRAVEIGRRRWALALHVVETGRRRWALAVRVVETGCRCRVLVLGAVAGSARGGHTLPALGAAAGCWLRTWWRCAYFCTHKLTRARSYAVMVLQIVASSMLQSQWILLGLGPVALVGFAVCAHTCAYAQNHRLSFLR